jgi:CRISPR system Cascade subunit CasE
MSTSLLTRVRLRRDVPAAALWRQLVPTDDDKRVQASHRLLWTLFADRADRERDFLWRESEPGLYFVLSKRAPTDSHGLFEMDPPKEFAPTLAAGDVLGFSLRVNATVARKVGGTREARGKPCDVVMNALHSLPSGPARAAERRRVIDAVGRDWLAGRGQRCGFRLCEQHSEGDGGGGVALRASHRVWSLDDRAQRMRVGVLDFEGMLVVEAPELFLASVAQGFGRAKAFGCGLMLIRRV